ncbi:hypothetical protein BGZ73_002469 [Actinomortierella ambigua]|nr:hypothetical protein BGZ73_002469 [Actinomortierella ambigua]
MHICKGLLILTATLVVLAKDAVVSRGVFNGDDTTNPDARGVKVFREPRNHPMAVASILMYAGGKAGYDPHSQAPKKSRHSYRAFRKQVSAFPGFLKGETFRMLLSLEGGSLDEVENKVRMAYPFADGDYIGSSIRYSIPTVSIGPDVADFVFSLVVISKPYGSEDPDDTNTKITIELVRLHLKIKAVNGDGAVQIPKQTAKLIVSQLEVKRHYLIRRAEYLAKKIPRRSLVDFVKYFWSKDPNADPPYWTFNNTPLISFQ